MPGDGVLVVGEQPAGQVNKFRGAGNCEHPRGSSHAVRIVERSNVQRSGLVVDSKLQEVSLIIAHYGYCIRADK